MKLRGKNVGMLVGPGYEDLEFWVPYMRMVEEGARVRVIGSKAGETFMSKHGCLPARSEAAAAQVNASALDAVLVPGGWAPDRLRRDPEILRIVREVHAAGGIIGLICHAGLVGISAGIIPRGGRSTGSEGIRDDLINAGAVWVDEPAFREGNIVWGRVVEDIPAYCRELVEALSGAGRAESERPLS